MNVARTVLPAEALRAIGDLAAAEILLVASDFDGTMAQIVPVPADARPEPESVAALRDLAAQPHTDTAVISGRALDVLRELTGLYGTTNLVGSHGLEFESGLESTLSATDTERLAHINRAADLVANAHHGVEVERKPVSTAIHYRHATDSNIAAILTDIEAGPASIEGVHVTEGKKVVEVAAVHTGKGAALDQLRDRLGATVVVFLGDDVTDEDAFARLRGRDVGVKVGPGPTCATLRIADTAAVAQFLTALADARRVR
ncbi:trehalose-phosphatase [Cumulibacter soli]|uniref:trehalose-phosphatase n=1 Tax=Cumulibacter soli TaxID=2546344 RepID=UPI001ABADBBB|nr:trehalose-phosphatase [Cumulibacter soli]